jgi:hypothetical protein
MAVGLSAQNQGSAGTTVIATLTGTVAAGSTIVAFHIRDNGSTFTSIASSMGGSFTQIGTESADATGGHATRGYYLQNAAGGVNPTVTLTKGSGAFATLLVVELTGMLTSGVLDQQNRQLDTASPFTSPSITTTSANEVLVGFAAAEDFGTNVYAESTGFTINQQFSNGATNWTCALGTRVVTATGSYNTSFTRTGAGRVHSWIASFIETGGGGGGSLPKHLMMIGCG